ncbi:MAG: hypothetical protein ABIG56_05850 [Candidatus Omnitrophota bacterium]
MEISIFIARIMGPSLLIIAVGIMFNQRYYRKVMEDFCKNSALLLYGGFLALFIGFLLVLSHNIWVAGWPVIITIYGWGGIIKGAWLIIFPNSVSKFMQAYQKNKILLSIQSACVLVIGVVLTFSGYFS